MSEEVVKKSQCSKEYYMKTSKIGKIQLEENKRKDSELNKITRPDDINKNIRGYCILKRNKR